MKGFLMTLGPLVALGTALGIPIVLPDEDPATKQNQRVSLSTAPGSLYESVGKLSDQSGECTQFYQGKGTAITAAHCFDDFSAAQWQTLSADFHCHGTDKGDTKCQSDYAVVEIAIPETYIPSTDKYTNTKNRGHDIAFIRIRSMGSSTMSENAVLPLRESPRSAFVSQVGYNPKYPGLTGSRSCHILPEDTEKAPLIKIACEALPGNSGGPLLDEANNVIGIMKSVNIIGTASYATPITPALKEAFEQFKAGTLEGKVETNAYGVQILRFKYDHGFKAPDTQTANIHVM